MVAPVDRPHTVGVQVGELEPKRVPPCRAFVRVSGDDSSRPVSDEEKCRRIRTQRRRRRPASYSPGPSAATIAAALARPLIAA